MMKKVAVIGLGTMGSMAIWQLAKEGVDVTGFEQFGIGHDRSAVGGESRLFRTAYREGAEYVPLLRRSRELWSELEQESDTRLLSLIGGLTIGKADSENVANVLKCIKDFGIEHVSYDVNEATELFPQHRFNSDDAVILDKESGYLRPELSVVTAVNQAKKHGAKIHRYKKIKQISRAEGGVTLSMDGESQTFDEVIVTTGPWAKELLPDYKQFFQPRRIIMSWFVPENLGKFQNDNFPIFARTVGEHDFFGMPTLDQSMVKIALVKPFENIENPDCLENNIGVDKVTEQIEIISSYFNGICPDPVRLSAHMDAYSPDDHALVGRLPEHPEIILMSGYSGHGFKLAPVMGEIACDLIQRDTSRHHIDHLNPGRFRYGSENNNK